MGNKINLHKRCIGIAMFILLFFGVNNSLKAQQIFQKEYSSNTNEYGKDLIKFNDSSYFFLGSKINSSGFMDILLCKTDSNFVLKWSKTYGDSLINNGAKLIKISDTSLVLICNKSNNNLSSRLLYLNLDGDTIWTREYYLQSQSLYLKFLDLSNDTLFLFGTSFLSNQLYENPSGIIMAINVTTGDLLWSNKFKLNSHLNTIFNQAISIHNNNQTNYYILGSAMKDSTNQLYNYDTFLMKLSDDFTAEKIVILTDSTGDDYHTNIDVSNNNSNILIGFKRSYDLTNFYYYSCLASFDSNLNFHWANKYELAIGVPDFDIVKYNGSLDNIYTSFLSYVYKMDSLGNVLKVKNIYNNALWPNGKAYFYSLNSNQNSMLWFGYVNHITSSFHPNLILVSTDENGVGCIDNNFVSLTPTPIPLLLEIDTTLQSLNIEVNSSSGIIYSITNLTSSTVCLTTDINEQDINNSNINIYPNPFNELFYVNNLSDNKTYDITVYNSSGQVIYNTQSYNVQKIAINLALFCQGSYYIIIEDNINHKFYSKLIKI